MKIALISLHTSPTEVPGQKDAGGMNVVVAQQAKALAELGNEVTIFTRASENISAGTHSLDESSLTPSNPRVIAIPAGPKFLAKEQLPTVVAEFAQNLTRIITGEAVSFDIFHSHYWLSGLSVATSLQSAPAPHAITFHTVAAQKNLHLAPGDSLEPAVRLEAEEELAQNAFIIASSMSELQGIVENYRVSNQGEHSRVINPGVDTDFFKPNAQLIEARHLDAHHLDNGNNFQDLRITVLGRQQPLKGQDLALAAFIELINNYPQLADRAKLIIAGEATPGAESYTSTLRSRAKQLSSKFASAQGKPLVEFLPAQTRFESAQLLASSDLVLIPSHYETFGLVALESAASGTPVLAADVTGLRESVKHGVSGFLIAGRDPAVWARHMAQLLLNKERLKTLSSSARTFALQRTWREHAQKLEETYNELAV